MSKKIEKMRWAAEDKIYRRDEWIRQDNEELLMLEKRLNDLDFVRKGSGRLWMIMQHAWNLNRIEWDIFYMRQE